MASWSTRRLKYNQFLWRFGQSVFAIVADRLLLAEPFHTALTIDEVEGVANF